MNIDKLTYAGNLASLESVSDDDRYSFELVDITNRLEIKRVFSQFQPDAVMHLAAESHVVRSIDGPAAFIETNVIGTYVLLDVARHYFSALSDTRRKLFRFLHVSTDEVYGDLSPQAQPFTESSPYQPSSPYSASKSSSDHLVRAWQRTYGLPVILTNCSNNYGAYQYPEKLIPVVILNALVGKPLPIYGNGQQVRDWLYVNDHAKALLTVLEKGKVGETYNIGGNNEQTNIAVVHAICDVLESLVPNKSQGVKAYRDLITYIDDRPGHDKRYAIDSAKIEQELGWKPQESFEFGLRKTVEWYLANSS